MQHRRKINDAWIWIKVKLRCNEFMIIWEFRCGEAKPHRTNVQIRDKYLHPIYKSDLRFGWTITIYKLQGQLESWIGTAWDLFG
jgi:hypothetical protein